MPHSNTVTSHSLSSLKTALTFAFVASFGLALIFTVGFAQGNGNVLHNAAHDTRHSAAFPCH
ncbi:MAG: CbtB domain-containing protein [Gammaproteobacteria bacterium]